VSLEGVHVPYVAVPRSPEPRRRRCSPWVVARRRRRPGETLFSSRARARRFGEDPVANGAPLRCFLVAPLLAAVRRRASHSVAAAAACAAP
jgi:hypothetical protein